MCVKMQISMGDIYAKQLQEDKQYKYSSYEYIKQSDSQKQKILVVAMRQVWWRVQVLVRELILRQIDKESRALKEENGIQGSQGGEKDKFFFSAFLHI